MFKMTLNHETIHRAAEILWRCPIMAISKSRAEELAEQMLSVALSTLREKNDLADHEE